ncbi:elongation factor P [Candidatus Peregrinibacteria bacterium]|jgi:elongation factor P|nr:elongation factor P [Candidatus Peregrinibacteria bacterium]MBT7736638.1 elongation factor P [Candidatus Peregrinibacteria bacterium]
MPTTTSIQKGMAISYKNQPWLIVSTKFTNPGKGQAFTKAKLKNLKTDQVIENTFKSGEAVELIDTIRKRSQFLYNDGADYHFMDNETYEQFQLDEAILGEATKYMKDGSECHALYIEGIPVSIQLQAKMEFEVTEAAPGAKGDTASGNASKEVTIETGTKLKVPLFINQGEKIIINTEDGTYVSKA